MMNAKLAKLPTGWKIDGNGFRVDYPHGSVRLIPYTNERTGKVTSWVACNYNPDGTASHAIDYPSFKQAVAAINEV